MVAVAHKPVAAGPAAPRAKGGPGNRFLVPLGGLVLKHKMVINVGIYAYLRWKFLVNIKRFTLKFDHPETKVSYSSLTLNLRPFKLRQGYVFQYF